MSRSNWKQTFLRVWLVLGALTFFAQCSTQPMWRSLLASLHHDAPSQNAAPPAQR